MKEYEVTVVRLLNGQEMRRSFHARSTSEAFVIVQGLFDSARWKIIAVKEKV